MQHTAMLPHWICVVFNHQLCISPSGDFFWYISLSLHICCKDKREMLKKKRVSQRQLFSLLMITCTEIITLTSTSFLISFVHGGFVGGLTDHKKWPCVSAGEKSSSNVRHGKAWVFNGHCRLAKQTAAHLRHRSAYYFPVLWLKSPLYEMPEQLWPFQ